MTAFAHPTATPPNKRMFAKSFPRKSRPSKPSAIATNEPIPSILNDLFTKSPSNGNNHMYGLVRYFYNFLLTGVWEVNENGGFL